MFAVIFVPNFGLQVQLRETESAQPSALVELLPEASKSKARIVAINLAAQSEQVEIGMSAAQGQARCGHLQLFSRSPETEQTTQTLLLRIADQFSPDFENTSPGVVTLDLTTMARGNEQNLGQEMVAELAKHALRAQAGFAKTPDLALMAAKQADPVCSLLDEDGNTALGSLPIDALDPPPDIAMVLKLWGIATVEDFLALPPGDMGDRLGPEAMDLWERISGNHSRLLHLERPKRNFSQRIEFEHEIETLEQLLLMIHRFLTTISSRLKASWLVADEILLGLDFSDATAYKRRFRVPDPTTDVELLFRMLQTHLDGFTTKSPITALRLEARAARGKRCQFHLFESGLRDPNRFAETLARLEGLLGSERVGMPRILDTHRPEAFRMQPFQEGDLAELQTSASDSASFGLPLRRFRPSVQTEVIVTGPNRRPLHIRSAAIQGEVRDYRGPWHSSGDWWAGENRWARVEWDIELVTGGLYRLVCEGKTRWKLEGVYG